MGAANGVHLIADLGLQRGRVVPPFDNQIAALDGLLRVEHQLVGLDRLEQVAVGPQRHRFHGRGGLLQRGKHQHFRIGPALLDLREDLHARAVGHGNVQRQQVGFLVLYMGDGLAGAGRLAAMEPRLVQPAADGLPRVRFLVDHQCAWRRILGARRAA